MLEAASAAADPAERLMHVTAFALSVFSTSIARESKPFNPLLGETYEWSSSDGKHRSGGRWQAKRDA